MAKTHPTLLPSIERILAEFGERVRAARPRRKLTTAMVAERAGISRPTLRQAEQGMGSVSLSAYAQILLALNLENDLTLLAKDDDSDAIFKTLNFPSECAQNAHPLQK
jgi:transcriptional regulator with XRE-family HTH domain